MNLVFFRTGFVFVFFSVFGIFPLRKFNKGAFFGQFEKGKIQKSIFLHGAASTLTPKIENVRRKKHFLVGPCCAPGRPVRSRQGSQFEPRKVRYAQRVPRVQAPSTYRYEQ